MANYNLTQTGAEVQVILDRVAAGYIYMGTADLTTTPDTTNPNVCYLLKAVGTYTNFGNIAHASGIGIALWNGSAWSYQNVPSAAVVPTDATPTEGSTNPVQSGGVYDAIHSLTDATNETIYEDEGQVEYYQSNGTYFGFRGIATYTPQLSEESEINRIYFPPFKGNLAQAKDMLYYIGYGNFSGLLVPNNLTKIAEGTIQNVSDTAITDYVVELDDAVTIPVGNRVFICLYGLNSQQIQLLGGGSAVTTLQPYSSDDALVFLLGTDTTTPFSQNWSRASGGTTARYMACNPILRLYKSAIISTIVDEILDERIVVDATPTEGSTNLVQSGGVYDAIEEKLTTNVSPTPTYMDGYYMLSGTIYQDAAYAFAVYDISSIVGKNGTINISSLSVSNRYINLWGVYNAIANGEVALLQGPKTNPSQTDEISIPNVGKYLVVQCSSTSHTADVDYTIDTLDILQSEIENLTPQPIKISLPNKIYAVVGDTLQLFYRGMVLAPDPYIYDIRINCEKGSRYERYFQYTPSASDIGTTTLSIEVLDKNGKLCGTANTQLVTLASPTSPSSSKKIVCLGDSLTTGGEWCVEAHRRLCDTGGSPSGDSLLNISFCGSKSTGNVGYFGAGGWTWGSYLIKGANAFRFQVSGVTSIPFRSVYSNNGHQYTVQEVNITGGSGNILCSVASASDIPTSSGTLTRVSGGGDATITFSQVEADSQNPLWDLQNNKMSFVPYANEYCNGSIDAIYILLTWNGLTPFKDDFATIIANVKTFADTLHSEFSSAKLKIMGIQMPNQKDMHGYGANGGYSDKYGMTYTAMMLNKAYQEFANQEAYSSWVEYVAVAPQFDSEYNMQMTEKAVNTRNTETEIVGNNGVHPAYSGYMQIADAAYRNIIAEFCQS